MITVATLGLILACSVNQGPQTATPSFQFLWRRPGIPGRLQKATVIGNWVGTTKGLLNLENGLYKIPQSPNKRNTGVSGPFRAPGQPTISFRNKELSLIWDTGTSRIAREEFGWKLYQFRPGTLRLLTSVDYPLHHTGEATLSGDPDAGTLMISSSFVGMSRENYYDYLFITQPVLHLSPLKVYRYFDIRRPKEGVLGVTLPHRKTMGDLGSLMHTPRSPLVLGNPYTGRVLWSNANYSTGYWMGQDWVLAQDETGTRKWSLLDSRTGKSVAAILPPLLGSLEPINVQTVDSYLILYDIRKNFTYAYRLLAPYGT